MQATANLIVRAHVDGEELLEEELAQLVEAEQRVAVHVVQPAALERRAASARDSECAECATAASGGPRSGSERACRLGNVAAVEQQELVEPDLDRVARRVADALLEPQLVKQTTTAR